MRKLMTISLLSAMPVVLAGTALVGLTGDDDGGRGTDRRSPAPGATPTTGGSAGRSAAPADASRDAQANDDAPQSGTDQPTSPGDLQFVCPEGGMDAVIELQHAVDEGHQPWRLSPEAVVTACTFGGAGTLVGPAGTNRYQVTNPATGETALVDVAQPLGPGTIWVVTSITVTPPTAPAGQCSPDAILPVLRDHLEHPGGLHIATVNVRQCQNGYARVFAVPEDSTCGQPNGSCNESEQVFLRASGDSWSVLTSGTGISCQDADVSPDLSLACSALGLS
jgi:hypothetical protein